MLLGQDEHVVGIDNMNDYYDVQIKEGRLSNLMSFQHFSFFKIDIENINDLEDLFSRYSFKAVINLAERAGVRYSMENPHIYMMTNAVGTLNLLDTMKKYNVKKFVLSSTSSLYAGQPMPFIETLPVNEPISPYAASKKAAEVMAYTYHYLYDFDVTILRYFTVYGSNGRPDMAIEMFLHNIANSIPITVFGDGTQTRDFTHVDDIARGTILAMKPMGYEVINLGNNSPIPLNEVISKIEERVNKQAIIDYKPYPKTDMKDTWADIEKAKKFLGGGPKIPFMVP